MAGLNIVDATIDDLQAALSRGSLTSVDLVAKYLRRISTFDYRGISLNAIPILNSKVFEEAEASDDRRAAGHQVRPLEGIPYTVKDSYKVKGMTVASGSPAFENLIANEDAFTIAAIRSAGGVLIGKTNMPPMAYGGMQRGIYGRAESPYNSKYLAAAFWSGSSNGSGVATTTSMAAFGMGEETVSSGRSPASNNALVAYTPSRGWISIRGNWPLYPTCDVVVPHTRTMQDLLTLLPVITSRDAITTGDFWRDQPFVKLEQPDIDFCNLRKGLSLQGIRIAVPRMYIGGPTPVGIRPVETCAEVVNLWDQARRDLEALGAVIVLVDDFPVVTAYEQPALLPDGCPQLPTDWHSTERGQLIGHAWNTFLRDNNDTNIRKIADVNPSNIYPDTYRTPAELKVIDRSNAIHFLRLAEYVDQSSMYDTDKIEKALLALEGMRQRLLEDWLSKMDCQCVAFPAAGDVAAAIADEDDVQAEYAWRNGVYYSNGNKALRHLGVPSVSVPMGVMQQKRMPVSLTLAGRAYDDANLLGYASAFELATRRRIPPFLTPALESDSIASCPATSTRSLPRPTIKSCNVTKRNMGEEQVAIEGTISLPASVSTIDLLEVEVTVDATIVLTENIQIEAIGPGFDNDHLYSFRASTTTATPLPSATRAPVARDKTMVVVLARARNGRPSGCLRLV